jgi:hypothetical protein
MDREGKKDVIKLLRARPPLDHEDVPFILLWAQKAGCTHLVSWYFWHLGLLDDAKAYKPGEHGISVHRYENQIFKARAGYRPDLARAVLAGKPLINFVRCPYQRVFSSYMEINNRFFIGLKEKGKSSPAMKIRELILRECYGEDVPLVYPVTLGDYLQWLARQDKATVEKHHSPQSGPLYSLPGIRHFRLEDSTTVFANLEQQFGLRSSASHDAAFSSGHHHLKQNFDHKAAIKLLNRGIPLARKKSVPLPRIDREILQQFDEGGLIAEIFRDDIALYESLEKAAR